VDQPTGRYETKGGGAPGVGAITAGGGAGGAIAHPASSTATHAAARQPRRSEGRGRMGWILLEALVALLIAVGIVWWTMGPKRKTRRRDPPADRR
jgi:hypothetical protein